MGRRERERDPDWLNRWRGPHMGKWWRRQLHKAERSWARGLRRSRSVAHLISTVSWKDS